MIIIHNLKAKILQVKNNVDPGLLLALFLSLIYFLVVFHSCLFRYNTFQYHDWDFSLYANGMWNIVHGNPYISISNKPFLGNHFNVIAFIIAPVFFIFRSPLTLLFLQSLSLALVTVPIYLLARRKFDWRASAGFSLIYLLYPSLVYVAMYEFHFEAFAPLFLALAFYFLITNRKSWLFVTAVLAMFCKENIPTVVFAMGVYAVLFRPRRRLVGLILALVSISYFLLVTIKLQPYFTPGSGIGYASHYGKYGKGFWNVYMFMLSHPLVIIKDLFSTALKRQFFYRILSPLLFLPLLRPDILLITGPTILKNLLSRIPTTHQIYWQYTAPLIPFMIISTMYGLKRLSKLRLIKRLLLFILGGVMITEIILSIRFYQESPFFVKYHHRLKSEDRAKKEAVKLIPKNASIMATFDFLPQLSMRKDLYTFYCIWKGGYYPKPPEYDYALVDFDDYFVQKDMNFWPEKVSSPFTRFLVSDEWGVRFARSDIVLFEKSPEVKDRKIVRMMNARELKLPRRGRLVIDNSLELADYKVEPAEEKNVIHVTFYWRIRRPIKSLYETQFYVSIGKESKIFHTHPLAYWYFTPVKYWYNTSAKYLFKKYFHEKIFLTNPLAYWYFIPIVQKVKILQEDYWLLLPDGLGPHEYIFSAGFVVYPQRRGARIKPLDKKVVDSKNRLVLFKYDNRKAKKGKSP